jgi:hypothetical protein
MEQLTQWQPAGASGISSQWASSQGPWRAKPATLLSALAGIELSRWDMEFRSLGKFNAEFKVPKIRRSLPSLAATTLSAPVSDLCGHAGQERCTMLQQP